jgi:hypothetical protein
MPQSPTAIPSVITMENTDGIISSVKFSRELFFLACLAVCKTVGAWFFFISNKISDGMGNYRQSIFRRTYSVGEAIGKTFTDDLHALHRRNE